MAILNVQQVNTTGLIVTLTPASVGGDSFPIDSKTFLQVDNGGVGTVTLTIPAVKKCDHGFMHDLVTTVAAGANALIGPFATDWFVDKTTGLATVNYSGVTNVTIAVVKP
jgi:hypothetical protein